MVMKYNKLENVQPVKHDSSFPIINDNKTAISSCPLIAHKLQKTKKTKNVEKKIIALMKTFYISLKA